MATVDTFDTATTGELTDHTSNSGHSYLTADADNTDVNVVETGSDDYAQAAFGQLVAVPDNTLANAEHFAEVIGSTQVTNATDRFGAVVGSNRGSYASGTFVVAYVKGDGEWDLFEVSAGTNNALSIQNAISGFAATTAYTLKAWLDGSGNAHVSIDGTETTPSAGVATNITLGNNAGFYVRNTNARATRFETGLNSASSGTAPSLESGVADMTAIRATSFTYDFTSHFSDSESMAYTVTGAPSGWSLDASAGTVTYTHGQSDVSDSPFTPHVIATDTEGNSTTASFALTVRHPQARFAAADSTEIYERSSGALMARTVHYEIAGQPDPIGASTTRDTGSASFASGEFTFTLQFVDISAGEQAAIVLYDPNDGDTRRYIVSAF